MFNMSLFWDPEALSARFAQLFRMGGGARNGGCAPDAQHKRARKCGETNWGRVSQKPPAKGYRKRCSVYIRAYST